MYREVADGETQVRFEEVSAYTGALQALGFRPLCRVAVGQGKQAAQVWVSGDETAFAEPEWMPGPRPMLVFRTALSDGAIIQTSTPREGAARFIPFWTRQHQPKAGYYLEEHAGMPHELWARHQAKVAEVSGARGARVLPHGGGHVFLDMAERTVRLARGRTRTAQWAGLALFLALVIPLTLARDRYPGFLLPLTALFWAAATVGIFRALLLTGFPRLKPPSNA